MLVVTESELRVIFLMKRNQASQNEISSNTVCVNTVSSIKSRKDKMDNFILISV